MWSLGERDLKSVILLFFMLHSLKIEVVRTTSVPLWFAEISVERRQMIGGFLREPSERMRAKHARGKLQEQPRFGEKAKEK